MSAGNATKIITRIKELPPLPLVVQKLLSVIGDANSSSKDLTRAIETDQALALKVLKLVNSSFYGFPGKISTISRAVVILGYSAIRNLALGLSAYDALKKFQGPVPMLGFWEHSISCAAGAHALATRIGLQDQEEGFIAGLLHDVGYLVMNISIPEEFQKGVENNVFGDIEAEKELLGISHAEAGIRLMEQWNLPEALCRVARFHHSANLASREKEPLLTAVMIADRIASLKGSGFIETINSDSLTQITRAAGIKMSEYGRIFKETSEKINNAKEFLNIADEAPGQSSDFLRGEEIRTVVVVSRDKERRDWIGSLLSEFGYHVVSYDNISPKKDDRENVHLVFFDCEGLDEEPMIKLAQAVFMQGIPVAFVADRPISFEDPNLDASPRLPLVFSKDDIRKLLAGRGKG